MKKYFGTDGIRTVAGEFPLQHRPLNVLGGALAREFASRLGRRPRFVLGGDTRESTAWIAGALAWGIRAEGGDLAWAGVIPTPGIAYQTTHRRFDAGIVVSASHNPFQDNGIKIFLPGGQKQDDALETVLEAALETVVPNESGEDALDLTGDDSLSVEYMEFLCMTVAKGLILSGLKVVVDAANGAASCYVRPVLESLGARVELISGDPDGRNINRDCGSLHLENLCRTVRETGADVGIALDGDADRCLFVNHEGEITDGDALMFVIAKSLDEKGELEPRTVVATVMSNLGLELALRERGVELRRTNVGDRYVLAELLRTGSLVGGEQSGHLIFPKLSLAGDGLMTALLVLRVMVESKAGLKDLAAEFVQCPQVLLNVRVREKVPFTDVPAIAEAARAVEARFAGRGRLLLRYSGTEKLARVMVEGENEEDVRAQARMLADIVKAELGD